jgi:hypothetical protein
MTDEDGRAVSKPLTAEEMNAVAEKKTLTLATATLAGLDKGSLN